ncbi:MAG: hypothetical protein [Circular genetic element sp.]|nr:MAG: hypothetical protein [Circular genetic element sp.]
MTTPGTGITKSVGNPRLVFHRKSPSHPPSSTGKFCFHCWTPILPMCQYFDACHHRFYDRPVVESTPATRARARIARTCGNDS